MRCQAELFGGKSAARKKKKSVSVTPNHGIGQMEIIKKKLCFWSEFSQSGAQQEPVAST